MKALVTGATGLVGQHLVEFLIGKDVEVISLGRDQNILNKLTKLGSDALQFDLTSDYDDFHTLDPFNEYIWFHVAAAISGAPNEILDAVNIEGTKKLINKAEDLKIPKLVLISSISTYTVSLEGDVAEDHEQDPESYYGKTKLEQERIVKQSTIPYVIVRPPYIGGPYDQNFLEEFASRIEKNKMPTFSKDGLISYVDARDLAQALYLVANSTECKNTSFNVKSDVITHSELVELLGQKLNVQPPYGPKYPYSVAMIVGILGEIWAKLRGKSSERSISRYRIRTLCRQFKLDHSKIMDEVSYQPKYSIEQSIDDWLKTRT